MSTKPDRAHRQVNDRSATELAYVALIASMVVQCREASMNDKLEAFRKHLREPEKKKTNWASWIGSPTAQFATILSLYNLFYSHAYYSDELIVVLSQARIHQLGDEIKVRLPKVTLVNSGTRAAAVLGIHLRHVQPPPRHTTIKDLDSCDKIEKLDGAGDVSNPAPIVFEHVVLKPGDIAVRSIRFDKNPNPIDLDFTAEESGEGTFRLTDINRSRKHEDQSWLVCLVFNIAATDATWLKPVELTRDHATTLSDLRERLPSTHTLVKRNNFWTSVGPIRQYY
jgi:hypothetical protein